MDDVIDALAAHLGVDPDVLHNRITSGEVRVFIVLAHPGGETRFPVLPLQVSPDGSADS